MWSAKERYPTKVWSWPESLVRVPLTPAYRCAVALELLLYVNRRFPDIATQRSGRLEPRVDLDPGGEVPVIDARAGRGEPGPPVEFHTLIIAGALSSIRFVYEALEPRAAEIPVGLDEVKNEDLVDFSLRNYAPWPQAAVLENLRIAVELACGLVVIGAPGYTGGHYSLTKPYVMAVRCADRLEFWSGDMPGGRAATTRAYADGVTTAREVAGDWIEVLTRWLHEERRASVEGFAVEGEA